MARIQYEHCLCMLPAMQETLNVGGTLDFGPLQIDANGIDCGRDFIRWDQILTARVHKTKLQIFGDGQSWQFDVANVPNVTVLLGLIRRRYEESVTTHADQLHPNAPQGSRP